MAASGRDRASGAERRLSPRIEILGQLDGFLMTVDTAVTILDLSEGGFGIDTPVPLQNGEMHECRFSLRDGVSVILLARVVHCRPKKSKKGATRYLAGFEFLEQPNAEAASARAQLLERMASNLPRAARKK
jgi:PilZ domain